MYKGNENKDLIRESSIDVAIVHGGLAIKENRKEYGRDANSGLLEYFSLLLKEESLIRKCVWTMWMWEYLLSKAAAEIFWQDLSSEWLKKQDLQCALELGSPYSYWFGVSGSNYDVWYSHWCETYQVSVWAFNLPVSGAASVCTHLPVHSIETYHDMRYLSTDLLESSWCLM